MNAQQTVQEVQAVTPYMFECVAFCFILASHFITNLIKKIRWFPAFMCKVKTSVDGNHSYRKLKSCLLLASAMVMSYAGVCWSLLQRYDNTEQVYVITGLICVLQWVIAEIAFKAAEGTKFEKSANVLKGRLYVPEDSHKVVKTIAYATGGGVDKRPKTVDFNPAVK